MRFKKCNYEGEEYICYASLLHNENHLDYSGEEVKKPKITKAGEIQIKMNVC